MCMLCRFIAVHNAISTNQVYPDYLRVITHADPKEAAIWMYVKHQDKHHLQIKANRAATASDTAGWYLALPPTSKRDLESNYLAVHPDIEKSMAVSVLGLHELL